MDKPSDRRRQARAALRIRVHEEVHRGRWEVRAKNISEDGICYSGSAFAPRIDGEEVILRLVLPGDPEPIEILGAITDERCLARWSETNVVFVWPSIRDRQRIRAYVVRAAAA